MLPERDPFEIAPQPISPLRRKIKEQDYPGVSKRLIKPTKRVVEIAMNLIKQGDIDEEYAQSVIVFDPKSKVKYKLSDYDVRDHKQESDQPHDYPGLNSGLLISGIMASGEETEGDLNLPRLPERVTKETLYPIQGFKPGLMRFLARSLERAVVVKQIYSTELEE